MSRKAAHRGVCKTPLARLSMGRLWGGGNTTLGGQASRALGWSFLSTAFGRLGLIGFGILLARLLGPHEFGTAAVAMVALLGFFAVHLCLVATTGVLNHLRSMVTGWYRLGAHDGAGV